MKFAEYAKSVGDESIKVRIPKAWLDEIKAEAQREGIPTSRFIREAAMARAVALRAARGKLDTEEIVKRLRGG